MFFPCWRLLQVRWWVTTLILQRSKFVLCVVSFHHLSSGSYERGSARAPWPTQREAGPDFHTQQRNSRIGRFPRLVPSPLISVWCHQRLTQRKSLFRGVFSPDYVSAALLLWSFEWCLSWRLRGTVAILAGFGPVWMSSDSWLWSLLGMTTCLRFRFTNKQPTNQTNRGHLKRWSNTEFIPYFCLIRADGWFLLSLLNKNYVSIFKQNFIPQTIIIT